MKHKHQHPVPQRPGLLHAICPVPIPSTARGKFPCSPAHGRTDSHGYAESSSALLLSPHQGSQEPHQGQGLGAPRLCVRSSKGGVPPTHLLGKGRWPHHFPLHRLCQWNVLLHQALGCHMSLQVSSGTLEWVGLEGTFESHPAHLPGMIRDITQIRLLRLLFSLE